MVGSFEFHQVICSVVKWIVTFLNVRELYLSPPENCFCLNSFNSDFLRMGRKRKKMFLRKKREAQTAPEPVVVAPEPVVVAPEPVVKEQKPTTKRSKRTTVKKDK